MKRFIKFFLVILFIITCMLLFETADFFGSQQYRPILSVNKGDNETSISWQRIPYPAYYEIEVLSRPPNNDSHSTPRVFRLMRFRTLDTQMILTQDYPFQTFWRVSAVSLFRRTLGRWSEPVAINSPAVQPAVDFTAVKPRPLPRTPSDKAIGAQPILLWTSVPGAVYYEFELLNHPPENANGIEPSEHRIFVSREIFTNGYNPDLRNKENQKIFWRVRGLDVAGNPIGVFSDATELRIDPTKNEQRKPLITSELGKKGTADLLYPVYTWIPLLETTVYEVEVTRFLPENPNSTTPSRHRIWSSRAIGFACYDELPRIQPGIYFYRVRGLNPDGTPLGVWSDAATYIVDPKHGSYAATFGDSITHGGGAISYSPADWDYDYQTYLTFQTYNLGHSGDTAETSAERFEKDVLPFRPRFLLIMTGINSLRAGVEASSIIKDLQSIQEKCSELGIRPIFLTLPPINPDAIHRTFSEETAPNWQKELAAVNDFIRKQPYNIDLYPYFLDSNGELPDRLAIDGLHYDIPGKKLMAERINAEWNRVTR